MRREGRRTAAVLSDAETGKLVFELGGFDQAPECSFFYPDSDLLAISARGGTVRFWNRSTGQQVLKLMLFETENDWLAVAPDGHYDGTEEAARRVGIRRAGDPRVVALQSTADELHQPGLLETTLFGERP